jgi:predicted N-acetyltransferase YhbS
MMIRAATEADVPALLAVLHAAFEEYRGRLDPPSSTHAETEASLRRKLATTHAAIAIMDGAAAGCVFHEDQPGRAYLSRLAVLPAHRGRGLGDALLRFAEERARASGRSRACLSVRLALPSRQKYYQRRGYRLVGQTMPADDSTPTYVLFEKELIHDECGPSPTNAE